MNLTAASEMGGPLVSVIMPAYNAARWIEEALVGLMSQTYANFELLVGDDGSVDRTLAIIHEVASRDKRVKVFSFAHRGVVAMRNSLMDIAKGQYVMFHDADDISSPVRMERQVSFLEANPVFAGVSSAVIKFGEAIPISRQVPETTTTAGVADWYECIPEVKPFKYGKKLFPFPASMFRAESLLKSGGFRPYFAFAEDADFTYRVAEHGQLAILEEPLFFYRQHSSNTSRRAVYLQTESSVLSRVVARRRRGGGADNLFERKPAFLRIFSSGLTAIEQAESLWLLANRLIYRILKNSRLRWDAIRLSRSP